MLGMECVDREAQLAAIIGAYNQVTERLKRSHDVLIDEVRRLREQLAAKDLELERRERLAALGEMAAGVAHEVRNPLGGIVLYASMLEDDLRESPAAWARVRQISAAARRLDGIVTDILSFAGDGQLKPRRVDVGEAVGEVVRLLHSRWSPSGCDVRTRLIAGDLVVWADEGQLQRALLNVVSNALDAVGAGGSVWIDVGWDGAADRVSIVVSDNGPGVPAAVKERVFHPFFTTKDSGTGLGLAIVHRILESHGGSIGVGDRDGGGAVFSLSLPRGMRVSENRDETG